MVGEMFLIKASEKVPIVFLVHMKKNYVSSLI